MAIEASETLDFKPSAELKRQMNDVSSPKAKSKTKTKPKASTKKAKSKSKSKSKSKTSAKTSTKRKSTTRGGSSESAKTKTRAAGPSGRKLVSREEVELDLPVEQPTLPDAPLQKVRRRRRSPVGGTGT